MGLHLYKYLAGHPDLAASIRKETEYFSRRFGEGESWYRAHFPLKPALGTSRLAFEATPDYLFYPPTPERVAEHLPDTRFIVLLRDPVERAYSHYEHMVRLGFERLSFEEAIVREPDRIADDLADLDRDPDHFCRALLRFSYVARGRYADQLRRWFDVFERSAFLILRSEDFFVDPANALRSVNAFLGIRSWLPSSCRNYSYAGTPPERLVTPTGVARLLRDVLEPDVGRLESLTGRSFGWALGRPS